MQGSLNMALDWLLAWELPINSFDAVLRFYTWSPPAVSLGVHQHIDSIDLDKCEKKGWEVTYRPTGGRSLLHLNDLCYAFAIKNKPGGIDCLKKVYNTISQALSNTLKHYGIEPDEPGEKTNYKPVAELAQNRICLGSMTRGEVQVNGKKVAASAQRILQFSVLQHGSILLDSDPTEITHALPVSEEKRIELANAMSQRAASISSLLGYAIDPLEFAGLFRQNLCKSFKMNYRDYRLPKSTLRDAIDLSAEFQVAGENLLIGQI